MKKVSSTKPAVLGATQTAVEAIQFYGQYGGQIREQLGLPPSDHVFVGLRPPIIAALLQPVSSGEEALAMLLEKARVPNSFRLDSGCGEDCCWVVCTNGSISIYVEHQEF